MKTAQLRERLNAHGSSSSKQNSTGGVNEEDKKKGDAWWGDLLVFLTVGLGTIWLYCVVIAFEAGERDFRKNSGCCMTSSVKGPCWRTSVHISRETMYWGRQVVESALHLNMCEANRVACDHEKLLVRAE